MNGILPKYLTTTALWDIYPQGAIGQAMEIYAAIVGKTSARTEPVKLPEAQRVVSQSGKAKKSSGKVMIIPIQGVIIPETDNYYGIAGLDYYTDLLTRGEADPDVIGFVLDIDSPGGSVMMLAEFAEFLSTVKKPTVAFTKGMMCSAAYYIASACKHIMSIPYSALIGNIGTVYRTLDMIPLFEKLGAKYIEVYGKEATEKDLGMKEARDGKPEQLREMLVTPFQNKFLSDIAKYRPAVDGKAQKGAIYTPPKALEPSLIDSVGYLADAIDKVYELAPGSNTYTQSKSTMNLSAKSIAAWLGLSPKAENDAELTLEDALAIKAKADSIPALEAKVTELTTAKTNLEAANATLTTEKKNLEAKVTELEAKITTLPGAAATAPVQKNTDNVEGAAVETEGKMEGEDEFMEKYGYGY